MVGTKTRRALSRATPSRTCPLWTAQHELPCLSSRTSLESITLMHFNSGQLASLPPKDGVPNALGQINQTYYPSNINLIYSQPFRCSNFHLADFNHPPSAATIGLLPQTIGPDARTTNSMVNLLGPPRNCFNEQTNRIYLGPT